MYLASLCFEQFTIVKPQTSRPANSELYIVGKGFKGFEESRSIIEQLTHILTTWTEIPENERMKEYIVPIPEDAYLKMYHALYRIYKRQIRYIQQNIKAVNELYPAPAVFTNVRTLSFFKSEQIRLQEWKKRFMIPFRNGVDL
jgi:hypothetical protein